MNRQSRLIFSILLISIFGQNAIALDKLHYLLTPAEAPDSLAILPKPPAYNTVSFLRDQAEYNQGYALKGAQRWKLAAKDADLTSVDALAREFSRAFGTRITNTQTPAVYRILQEIIHDASMVTRPAKNYYMRTRPFVFYHNHTCAPQWDSALKKNGSYPSGHTTIGWATALVLAEINPSRQDMILRRGYSYGQSRVICGAHWQSDVDAGRITGASLVARLNANKQFRKWVSKAQREVKQQVS